MVILLWYFVCKYPEPGSTESTTVFKGHDPVQESVRLGTSETPLRRFILQDESRTRNASNPPRICFVKLNISLILAHLSA